MLKAKLVVVGGDAKAAEITLSLPTIIGRGRDVTLTLPHPLVSRSHCELFEKEGVLHVRDMESLNGTYVDNRRIEGTSELNPDQLLTIGNVTFRAVYEVPEVGDRSDELAATVPAGTQVVEFNELDAHDNGEPGGESIRDRKTVPGKPEAPARPISPDKRPGDNKPMRPAASAVYPAASAETSEVLDEPFDRDTPIERPLSEHSVVQAMTRAGVAGGERVAAGSLSEIQRLMPDVSRQVMASGIDGFDPGDEDAVGDEDFHGVDSAETVRARVKPNDSALGSFIRKLPK